MWKVGQVVPIFKKGNLAEYTNYCTVTLLPLFSKVMEQVMLVIHQQLKDYLASCHILHSSQHGFRSKRSYCSALLYLSNTLLSNKNNSPFSSIAVLDYLCAFDTINHLILLHKLANIGFGPSAISWFKSYLTGHMPYMCCNGVQSD